MSASGGLTEGTRSLKSAVTQSVEAGVQQGRSRLHRWLMTIVGEENRECVLAIVEAALILTEDIIKVGSAISNNTSIILPMEEMFLDIVDIALSLPPKCLSDEYVAANFGRVYEIMQLARKEAPGDSLEIRRDMVDLIRQLPDMEILDKFPGLDEQLVDKLTLLIRDSNLNTQADIMVALLPDDALKELDEALNYKATDLPGAGFITTLNDYDNQLGIDIIPDNVVEGPAIDLVLRTVGVAGLVDANDTEMLLGLVDLLRTKVAQAKERTIMDRIKTFVKALAVPSLPDEEEPLRKPVRIEIVPKGEEIMAPTPTGRIEINEGVVRRMKVLAGIQ